MKHSVISIIGGESLLAQELRDQLKDRGYPVETKLLGTTDDEFTRIVSLKDGEAAVLPKLDAETLAESEVVFLTGNAESSSEAWEILARVPNKPFVVDLTASLDNAGVAPVPHPAASVLHSIFSRILKHFKVRRSVVNIFEPVSERGKAGMDELQQQTASLLNLKKPPKEVFDTQVSFTMVPRYGSDAPLSLAHVEQRIYHDLAALFQAAKLAPLPSLRLIQAPVFHGYSMSLWVEFEENPGAKKLALALASSQIEIREDDLEPPTNTGAVGQQGTTVGMIELDRNDPKALWFWAVADNFRIVVDDAIELARPYLEAGQPPAKTVAIKHPGPAVAGKPPVTPIPTSKKPGTKRPGGKN